MLVTAVWCALGSSSTCLTSSVIHSEVKPFKCNACGKAFTQASHRSIHRTGDGRPHSSLLCPHPFRDSGVGLEQLCALRGHVFQCPLCLCCFTPLLGTPGIVSLLLNFSDTGPMCSLAFRALDTNSVLPRRVSELSAHHSALEVYGNEPSQRRVLHLEPLGYLLLWIPDRNGGR